MASDLSIHNMLLAGTAGVESKLSGTPTIFFDDLNFNESIFYKNNNNSRIVFNDWKQMLDSINNNIFSENLDEFYNWDKVIDKIDPYRDGKSRERVNFTSTLCLN